MVRSLNRAAFRRVCGVNVRGAYLFSRETYQANHIGVVEQSSGAAIRSPVGRDSLESSCPAKAPRSLFAPVIRPDYWRVLGGLAYPGMVFDAELSDNHALAGHLCQSCFLVGHFCLSI